MTNVVFYPGYAIEITTIVDGAPSVQTMHGLHQNDVDIAISIANKFRAKERITEPVYGGEYVSDVMLKKLAKEMVDTIETTGRKISWWFGLNNFLDCSTSDDDIMVELFKSFMFNCVVGQPPDSTWLEDGPAFFNAVVDYRILDVPETIHDITETFLHRSVY